MPHVTFIHGILNKPPAEKLRTIWNDSLKQKLSDNEGVNLGASGVTTSMIYWADVLYENCLEEGDFESVNDFESLEDVADKKAVEPDMSWRSEISGKEKEMVDALAAKLSVDLVIADNFTPPESEIDQKLERIPLPWFIKKIIMKQFLKDVHHYLFNVDFSPRANANYKVQEEIRSRVIKQLKEDSKEPGPHIVVSHSMGTVIAYDCLMRVADCPAVDGLMTIGSPLGIDEVQDKLAPEWTRDKGFPEKVKGSWVNVYDYLDPVTGFDGNIANDFKKNGKEVIEVINEQNWGKWRHNITNYLSGRMLREALSKQLNL